MTSTSLDHVYAFLYKLTKGYATLPQGAPPHTLPRMPLHDGRLSKISRQIYALACKVYNAEAALHEARHATPHTPETSDSDPDEEHHHGAPGNEDDNIIGETIKEVNIVLLVVGLFALTPRTFVSSVATTS